MNTSTKQTAATLAINTAALINTIKAADLARGKDNSLPMLTTYRLELRDNKLQFITTDRYRLAIVSLHLDETQAADLATTGLFDDGLTLDGTLTNVAKIKTKHETLNVTITPQGLNVTYDGGTINTPTYDDIQFPRYRDIIAGLDTAEQSTNGNYNPRYLADAAKACEIIAGKNTSLNITLRGNKPATLKTSIDGLDIFILLMPVRVAN